MMKYFITLLISVASVFLNSCATKQAASPTTSQKLHFYFVSADSIEKSDFNLEAWNTLKTILHQQLQSVGDDMFSATLSKEKQEIQISVVNCMGFSNPSEYNQFPKTKYVFASSPKI